VKKPLIATAGVVMLACLGWIVVQGMSEEPGAFVEWSAEDEVTIVDHEAESAGVNRSETDVPQAPAQGEAADNRPEVTLRGRVVNGFKQPVANAQVLLELRRQFGGFGPGQAGGPGARGNRQQVRKPVTTGSDGTFAFQGKGFEDLVVSLAVTHKDYAPTSHEREFRNAKGTLDVGDLEVHDGGALIGTVLDSSGAAIIGATARVLGGGGPGPRMFFGRGGAENQPPTAQTDRNGMFRIEHIPSGEYRVEASAPQRLQATSETVFLAEDSEEILEPLHLGPGHQLNGTVFDLAGRPVAEADVALMPDGRGRDFDTRTDKNGVFAFDHLQDASFSLRVSHPGFVTLTQSGVAPKQTPNVTLQLQDGLKITGVAIDEVTNAAVTRYGARLQRVGGLAGGRDARMPLQVDAIRAEVQALRGRLEAGGDPAAANVVRARIEELIATGVAGEARREFGRQGREPGQQGRDGQRGRPAENIADNGPGRGFRGGRNERLPGETGDVLARPGGRFSFTGLDEGSYVIDIGSPDHQKVRSQVVELRTGQAAPELTIVLPRGLTVAGTVLSAVDRSPVRGADVELVLQEENGGREPGRQGREVLQAMFRGGGPRGTPVMDGKTDAQGRFAFLHAPPGRYLLSARAQGYATQRSEVFDLVGDSAGFVLELGPLATLEGKVSGIPRGKEERASVVLFAGFGNMRTEKVAADGTYKATELQPGSWFVRAFVGDARDLIGQQFGRLRGQAGAELQPDVVLAAGDHKTHNLVADVQTSGTVTGTVLKNGDPGKGLRVTLQNAEMVQQFESMLRGGPGGGRGGPGGGGGGERGRGGRFPGANSFFQTIADGQGAFTFKDVPTGSYALRVEAMGGRGQLRLHEENLQVAEDRETRVQVSLLTGTLEGTITTDDGTPVAQLQGSLRLYPGMDALPSNPEELGRTQQLQPVPVRNGAFRVTDLTSGEYLLVTNLRNRERALQKIYVSPGGVVSLKLPAGKKTQAGPSGPSGQPRTQPAPGTNQPPRNQQPPAPPNEVKR
jgi:hypothetical protein